jgi:MFS family permease
VVADVIPLYPLYALFAIWSGVAILAEVPSGAIADRFSRRGSLVAAGVLQAAGYAVWISLPGFAGFAAGFVLWGLGGSLVSGSQEALLYDGLDAVGAAEHYALVQGRVATAGLISQFPAAGAATVLFAIGGYPLVRCPRGRRAARDAADRAGRDGRRGARRAGEPPSPVAARAADGGRDGAVRC